MRRKENDREEASAFNELRLKLHSGHAGHAVVKEQAARLSRIIHLEKGLRALIGHHLKASHAKQKGEALQLFRIVVDDPNEGILILSHHYSPFGRPGSEASSRASITASAQMPSCGS